MSELLTPTSEKKDERPITLSDALWWGRMKEITVETSAEVAEEVVEEHGGGGGPEIDPIWNADKPEILNRLSSVEVEAASAEEKADAALSGLVGKEVTTNRVTVSSTATTTQYPNAKSVWDLCQEIIALIPAGGLKIPSSLDLESELPTSGQQDGDYYFIQNMDITASGKTGRAWWNSSVSTTNWQKVFDQYFSPDGLSIILTEEGSLAIATTWLDAAIVSQVENKIDKVPTALVGNLAVFSTDGGVEDGGPVPTSNTIRPFQALRNITKEGAVSGFGYGTLVASRTAVGTYNVSSPLLVSGVNTLVLNANPGAHVEYQYHNPDTDHIVTIYTRRVAAGTGQGALVDAGFIFALTKDF